MKLEHKLYMQAAIREANKARAEGGVAIGAVLVSKTTGEIISAGGSLVSITRDPTAHAEINCIRAASKKWALLICSGTHCTARWSHAICVSVPLLGRKFVP